MVSSSSTPRRLLVIGDDAMMRLFLQNYLSDTYDVEAREEGTDALEWLREGGTADLVIADLSAPEFDGLAFTESLRAEERLERLPLLLVSGSDGRDDIIRCLEAGANDFVLKPFNPVELTVRIEHLFRRFE